MLSSSKSKIKSLVSKLPIIGPGIRFVRNMLRLPAVMAEVHNRVVALHDQLQALPSQWSPVTEQVWEAQAVSSQLVADDLRVALDRARKEHSAILDTIDRRLASLEQRRETAMKHAA